MTSLSATLKLVLSQSSALRMRLPEEGGLTVAVVFIASWFLHWSEGFGFTDQYKPSVFVFEFQ
jgi:hypothetical protein